MMLGVDVSNWQGIIDWKAMKAAGVSFAYAKASESIDFQDQFFAANRSGAAAQGIAFGAYHASHHATNDPLAEASWFCDTIISIRADELRPMLDMETAIGGTPSADWASKFLAEVERRMDVRGVLYSNYADLKTLQGQSAFTSLTEWPLWLAYWGANDGKIYAAPTDLNMRMICQQYTSKGTLTGVTGTFDLDTVTGVNLMRETGDYQLWRDWKLNGGTRPIGLPMRVTRTVPTARVRWLDALDGDTASFAAYAAAQTAPLQAQIAQLNAQIATLQQQTTADQAQISALQAQVTQLQSDLDAANAKIAKAIADLS